ncbi:hypothetical protein QE152_g31988, partial [Popillia japonica]
KAQASYLEPSARRANSECNPASRQRPTCRLLSNPGTFVALWVDCHAPHATLDKKAQASYLEPSARRANSECNPASRQRPTCRLLSNPGTFVALWVDCHAPHATLGPAVSCLTQELLSHFGWTVMPHMQHLSDQRFRSDNEVKEEVKRHLNGKLRRFTTFEYRN